MSKTDQNQTSRIIDILASGSPNHGLKEAVHSALSEKVGIVLDELKNTVAESYFGQSAQSDLDEGRRPPLNNFVDDAAGDKHQDEIHAAVEKLKSKGHKVIGGLTYRADDSGGTHHETRIEYTHAKHGTPYQHIVRTRARRYGTNIGTEKNGPMNEDAAEKDGLAESQMAARAGLAMRKPEKPPQSKIDKVKAHMQKPKYDPKKHDSRLRSFYGTTAVMAAKKQLSEGSDLQELSKKTLGSYVKKASRVHGGTMASVAASLGQQETGASVFARRDKQLHTVRKREKGIDRAADKLAKEDTDLQELSKKTLGSYIGKAAVSIKQNTRRAYKHQSAALDTRDTRNDRFAIGDEQRDVNLKTKRAKPFVKKINNRATGLRRAAAKLAKEDLQELSKKTLGSYIKKASHDVAHKGAATREFSNRSEKDRKDGNYVGARKNSDLSDKVFNKSWKRRQGMAKAVDKLTKD